MHFPTIHLISPGLVVILKCPFQSYRPCDYHGSLQFRFNQKVCDFSLRLHVMFFSLKRKLQRILVRRLRLTLFSHLRCKSIESREGLARRVGTNERANVQSVRKNNI